MRLSYKDVTRDKKKKKITGQQGGGDQSTEVHSTVKQKHVCAFPSLSIPFLAHITTQPLYM